MGCFSLAHNWQSSGPGRLGACPARRRLFLLVAAGSWLWQSPHGFAQPARPPDSTVSSEIPVQVAGPGLEQAEALRPVFSKLEQLRQGQNTGVRITVWGDSHVANDVFTGQLRELLQDRYGDGGPGLVLLGKPWRYYRHQQVQTGTQGTWKAERVWGRYGRRHREPRDLLLGVGGIRVFNQGAATAWVKRRTAPAPPNPAGSKAHRARSTQWSVAEVFFLFHPGGGTLAVTSPGQAELASWSTQQDQTAVGFRQLFLPPQTQQLELKARDGEVRLYGLDLRSHRPGVILDVLGLNGARADHVLQWDAAHWTRQVQHLAPDLLVLAYGSNEVDDRSLTVQRYQAQLKLVLQRFRQAAPRAACLLLGPPDQARRRKRGPWRTPPTLELVIQQQRRLARHSGCAFWNPQAAMGGPGTIEEWQRQQPPLARRDRLHFTAAGYRLLGQRLFQSLMEAAGSAALSNSAPDVPEPDGDLPPSPTSLPLPPPRP